VDGSEKLGFAARALNCCILCGLRGWEDEIEKREDVKARARALHTCVPGGVAEMSDRRDSEGDSALCVDDPYGLNGRLEG